MQPIFKLHSSEIINFKQSIFWEKNVNVKFFVTFLMKFLKNSASDDTWWQSAANIPQE